MKPEKQNSVMSNRANETIESQELMIRELNAQIESSQKDIINLKKLLYSERVKT